MVPQLDDALPDFTNIADPATCRRVSRELLDPVSLGGVGWSVVLEVRAHGLCSGFDGGCGRL